MKKSFLITKAAAIALAFTALVSCGKSANTSAPSTANASSNGEIGFVYIDSLVNGYDFYNDEATKLMAKQSQYEQELNSKGKSIERRAMELQSNVQKNLVTPTRAQEIGSQLQAEQQKLLQLRDQQAMELQDDNAQIMSRVGDSIKNYIKEFNADGKYKYILSTQGSSSILYGDPSMDLTNTILKALNDRYNKNGGAAAVQTPADTTQAK